MWKLKNLLLDVLALAAVKVFFWVAVNSFFRNRQDLQALSARFFRIVNCLNLIS